MRNGPSSFGYHSPLDETWEQLHHRGQPGTPSWDDQRRHPFHSLVRLLDAMTEDEHLWSIEAVQSAAAWENVRSLARALLENRTNAQLDR